MPQKARRADELQAESAVMELIKHGLLSREGQVRAKVHLRNGDPITALDVALKYT